MPTRLYFDKAHYLTVEEDLNAVEGALRQASPGPAAVVALTKKKKKVLVNASLVRAVQELPAAAKSKKRVRVGT